MAYKKNMDVEDKGNASSESWNIAQFFTGSSVAFPLQDLDILEDIARFGTVAMDDDLVMSDDVIDRRRAEAVRRYWQKLKQIVYNTLFKITKSDRDDAKIIKEWLDDLPRYFDALLNIKKNNVSNEDKIEVNEEFLTELLDKLVTRKQEYLVILNHAGLIFRQSTDIDLDDIQRNIFDSG